MLCVALWGDKAGAERIAELDWACEHRAFTGLSVVRGRERLLVFARVYDPIKGRNDCEL